MVNRIPANPVTADTIMRMVSAELWRAIDKHPMRFNSAHEGHSVLREEFEELWDHVKADTGYTMEGFKEAIQTAAMACRYVLELQYHHKAEPGALAALQKAYEVRDN